MTIYLGNPSAGVDNAAVGVVAPFAATSANLKYHTGIAGDPGIINPTVYSWEGASAGATDGVGRIQTSAAGKVVSVRYYARYSIPIASPLTSLTIMTIRGTGDTVTMFQLYHLPTGFIRLGNSGSSNFWTSNVAFPINEDVCIDVWVNSGTTTTDGTAQVRVIRRSDGATVIDSGVITNNFGAGALDGMVRVFKPGAEAYTGDIRWDLLEVRNGTDSNGAFIGPYVPPVSSLGGSVTITPDPHVVGQEQTMTITATGGNGNAITYSGTWDGVAFGPQSSNIVKRTDATPGTKNWTAKISQPA